MSGGDLLRSSYVLSKAKALELFPMLKKNELKGAIVYYDGMHNDARMALRYRPVSQVLTTPHSPQYRHLRRPAGRGHRQPRRRVGPGQNRGWTGV